MRTILVLAATLLFAAACSSDGGRSDDPWEQVWHLGAVTTAEGALDDIRTPMGISVEFRPVFRGSNGCSLFEGRYDTVATSLRFPSVAIVVGEGEDAPMMGGTDGAALRCEGPAPPAASEFQSALLSGVELVDFTADEMVWRVPATGTMLEFYPGVEG